MDGTLLGLVLSLLGLVALDLAALRWGHDSRPVLRERRDWW